MYPTPLPLNPFPESAFRNAYERCLALEATANSVKRNPGYPPPLVCARILGHLLHLAPNNNSRGQIQWGITSTASDAKLMEVAGLYFNSFIRVFKRSSGSTPAPSEHPTRPSFEDVRAYAKELMRHSQLDHRRARDAALLRADNCCMVTGRRSIDHGGTTYLRAAHIIPESTGTDINKDEKKGHRSAGIWAILSTFTDVDITLQLAGNPTHRPENIILMSINCHLLFDDLRLWFKPVEGHPHTYHTHVSREELREDARIPERVTFSTTTDFPLPDSAYIALHALCCDIAWMSGAAEHIMDIERRMDGTDVLAHDGSTADLLASELARIPVY